jgi:hypothetical protein
LKNNAGNPHPDLSYERDVTMEGTELTQWQTNKNSIGYSRDYLRHAVVRGHSGPLFGINAPGFSEREVDLFSDMASKIAKSACEFFLNHVLMDCIGHDFLVEHRKIGLQKIAVDLALV